MKTKEKIDQLAETLGKERETKTERRRGVDNLLLDIARDILPEYEYKIQKKIKSEYRMNYIMPAYVTMEKMLRYYIEKEDGELYVYLKTFAMESYAATYDILKNRGTMKKKGMTLEEEAISQLSPLEYKLFHLTFKNGDGFKTSEEVAKDMSYLDAGQVSKVMAEAMQSFYIHMDIYKKAII